MISWTGSECQNLKWGDDKKIAHKSKAKANNLTEVNNNSNENSCELNNSNSTNLFNQWIKQSNE